MKTFILVVLMALVSGCVSTRPYYEVHRAYVDRTISCLVGSESFTFVRSTSLKSDMNGKKHDTFGYITNTTLDTMKDNSFERTIFFTEKSEEQLTAFTQMKLKLNDEVMKDGWMHGEFYVLGILFPDVSQYRNININKNAKCVYVTGETEEKLIKIALQTESKTR